MAGIFRRSPAAPHSAPAIDAPHNHGFTRPPYSRDAQEKPVQMFVADAQSGRIP